MTQTFLRIRDVETATGYARSSIYRLVKADQFPKPVPLGAKAVGWIESEIKAWQEDRIAKRDQGEAA